MKNRRGFLVALSAVTTTAVSLAVADEAAAMPGRPSAAALAIAATYRRFDATLSDAELTTIARSIDDDRTAAAKLNPRSKPLRNSDDLVVRFAAAEHI